MDAATGTDSRPGRRIVNAGDVDKSVTSATSRVRVACHAPRVLHTSVMHDLQCEFMQRWSAIIFGAALVASVVLLGTISRQFQWSRSRPPSTSSVYLVVPVNKREERLVRDGSLTACAHGTDVDPLQWPVQVLHRPLAHAHGCLICPISLAKATW